jgi:hypothetical protein
VIKEGNSHEPDCKRQQTNEGKPVRSGESNAVPHVKPFYAPKILRFDPQLKGEDFLYDKVSNHQSDLLTFGGQCT